MGLIGERNGLLRLRGPGSLLHGAVLFIALLLLMASVAVPLHEGNVNWSDAPPVFLCFGFFLFAMISFDNEYLIDPRRREISRQTTILQTWTWTRKLADFADIRGYYLTQPESTTTRSAILEVLLPGGRVLDLRLGSEHCHKVEGALQALLLRYQIEPGSLANSRTIWDAPHEHTGCLVSFFGCASPLVLGLILGLVECFLPGVHLGLSPVILGLLFSLIFLGPLCNSGWRAIPAKNQLQRYFSFGRWTFRKTSALDDCLPEIQRLPEPDPRRFALVLKSGVRLDQFVSEAQAQVAMEQFRRLLP